MKKVLILLLYSINLFAQNQSQNKATPVKMDKEFLGIKFGEPFSSFKDYELINELDDYDVQKYSFTNTNKIPNYMGFPVEKGEFEFYKGKLKSMQLTFDSYNPRAIDTFKYHFTVKYGLPLELQGRYDEYIWENDDYSLKLIAAQNWRYSNFLQARIELNSKVIVKDENEKARKEAELAFRKVRFGKGNGTFIPDITSTIRIINASGNIRSFESGLSDFTVPPPDTMRTYNKATQKHDIFDAVRYTYRFKYKGISVKAEVEVNKNKVIKVINYDFASDPFFRLAVQRNQNGLIINEPMTKMISKMGLNNCTVYDNPQKISLTVYSSTHFTIRKSQ